MEYLLCINFREGTSHEAIGQFLDKLEYPWEWGEVNVSVARLVIVRCEDLEMLTAKLRTVPDRNICTAFGFMRATDVEPFDWKKVGDGKTRMESGS